MRNLSRLFNNLVPVLVEQAIGVLEKDQDLAKLGEWSSTLEKHQDASERTRSVGKSENDHQKVARS